MHFELAYFIFKFQIFWIRYVKQNGAREFIEFAKQNAHDDSWKFYCPYMCKMFE